MKQGQIVMYYPADNDQHVSDRNGASSFPAIVTQIISSEGSPDRMNICAFLWNGMSPILSVLEIPEGFGPEDFRDVGYVAALEPSEVINESLLGSVQESITKTQEAIEEHAKRFDEGNENVLKDVNHQIGLMTELVTNFSKDLADRISKMEKADAATDQAIGELHKRIQSIEKKK